MYDELGLSLDKPKTNELQIRNRNEKNSCITPAVLHQFMRLCAKQVYFRYNQKNCFFQRWRGMPMLRQFQ
jgi:hypothetical protein